MACALLTEVAPAHAEESEPSSAQPDARSRDLFLQGASLARANRWLEALAAFEESARLLPHAKTSFNVGYCRRSLGRFTAARAAFREALELEARGAELSTTQLEAAREYLEEAESLVVRAVVEIEPEGSTITVDGSPIVIDGDTWMIAPDSAAEPQSSPERRFTLLVDPGRHVLTARSPSGESQTLEVNPATGESPTWTIVVLPAPTQAAAQGGDSGMAQSASAGERGPTTTKDVWSTRTTFGIVLGSGGLTAAILASAFTAHAAWTFEDAAEACPLEVVCPDDRAQALTSEADDFADAATVSWAVAVAAAAGSVRLFTLPENVTVSASASGLAVNTRF